MKKKYVHHYPQKSVPRTSNSRLLVWAPPCTEVGIYGGLEVNINKCIHNFQPLARHEFQLLKSVGNLTKVFFFSK